MIATLKAEIKKLLTIRSTYVVITIALALASLFTYLGTSPVMMYEELSPEEAAELQKQNPDQPLIEGEQVVNEPIMKSYLSYDLPKEKLVTNLMDSVPFVSMFIAIVVVLLMAHEFRHNTITYTLTASNSRSKVLGSKLIVGTIFSIVAALLALGLVTLVTFAAINIKGLHLPAQDYNWLYIVARLVTYSVGFSLLGLAIITLVRSMVAGIAALFILPTIDSLAGLLLTSREIEPTKALPLSALNRVEAVIHDIMPKDSSVADQYLLDPKMEPASVIGALTVFLVYLVGIWIITWILFLRRDAN